MATPGKVNGTNFLLYVDGNAVAYSTSASINIVQDTLNTTTGNSGNWNNRLPGRRDWDGTVDGLVVMHTSGANTNNAWQIFNDYMSYQQVIQIKFSTDVSGDQYWQGDAIITSLSMEAPMEETTTFSASFVAAGPLTKPFVP
tara:strand:- start:1909 stop:2334 length:426 start_codon:yes stop_codon:yes gene_type:complete